MEKLSSQLIAHVSHTSSRQLKKLAEAEGSTPSEYLRVLIEDHLQEKRRWYEGMKEVFEGTGNGEV